MSDLKDDINEIAYDDLLEAEETPKVWQLQICPICGWGLLRRHPEWLKIAFRYQVKCGLCGFVCRADCVPKRAQK